MNDELEQTDDNLTPEEEARARATRERIRAMYRIEPGEGQEGSGE